MDGLFPGALLATVAALFMIAGGAAIMFAARGLREANLSERMNLIASGSGREAGPGRAGGVTPSLSRAASEGASTGRQRQIDRLRDRLGIPPRYSTIVYPACRAVAVAILGVAGWMLNAALLHGAPLAVEFLGPAVFAAVGWIVPGMLFDRAAKRHVTQSAEGLPDALELLVVCVEAGMSLDDAIDRITEDLKWSRPALAEELMLTSADLKILPERDQALTNLATRIDVPSVRAVVTSLSQTLRYGTPLAQALKSTASELRNDSLVRMEEKAAGLPALLTLPMMLFIMPTVFMILLGPAVLRILDMVAKR